MINEELLNCVVFCGGNSMMRNFPQRLRNEIDKIVSPELRTAEIEYRADSLRKYSAWSGGSMIGSLRTFQNLAITKAEYDENPEGKISIVHKRTF